MKRTLIAILLIFVVSTSALADNVRYAGSSPLEAVIDGTPIKIHFGGALLYATQGYFVKTFPLSVEVGGRLALNNKFIKGRTGTIEIQYSSSNENVLYVDEKGVVSVMSPGSANLVVAMGGKTMEIPFSVKEIPIPSEATQEEIIRLIGMPDSQDKIFVEWATSKGLDGILYTPTAQDVHGISVEHWKYNKYPEAILRFRALDKLTDVTNPETEYLPTVRAKLEFTK